VEGDEGVVKGMSKDEIERLLKHGAYHLFKNNEEEVFDLDKILEHAKTLTYASTSNQKDDLKGFSQVTTTQPFALTSR
jgi:predicted site-specific integrase-resolvase